MGGAESWPERCILRAESYSIFLLLSSTFLLIGVVSTLFAIDPFIASLSFAGFGGLYGLIMFSVRTRLVANSQLVAKEQTKVVKALQEGLGGIRDRCKGQAQPGAGGFAEFPVASMGSKTTVFPTSMALGRFM